MTTLAVHQQHTVLCAFLYPPRLLTTPAARRAPSRTAFRNARRNFSQTFAACDRHQRMVDRMQQSNRDNVERASKPGPSMSRMSKQQMKTQMAGGQQDFDIGLFPGTLVMPTSSSSSSSTGEGTSGLPSLISTGRWRLEFHRAKTRVLDLASLLYMKFFTGARPRPKLELTDTADIARRLHYDMWTAFAAGDESALRRLCSQGVLQDLLSRLARRPKGESLQWTLHQYNARPAVASHRAAQIPNSTVAIRQAVVRIRSRQSMEKASSRRKVEATEGQERDHAAAKDLDEYLVIQRSLVNGKVGDWFVWGTTQESNVDLIVSGAK